MCRVLSNVVLLTIFQFGDLKQLLLTKQINKHWCKIANLPNAYELHHTFVITKLLQKHEMAILHSIKSLKYKLNSSIRNKLYEYITILIKLLKVHHYYQIYQSLHLYHIKL
jgi:hypothetical protein